MSSLDQIFKQAGARRAEHQLPYAGAVTPGEAFELLQLDSRARLVDVRTRAELDWVGRPLVGDGQYVHIEWTRYPGGVPNAEFLDQLKQAVPSTDTPVLFLCRSAARSKLAAAAAAQAGYQGAYDLLEGFEGDKDGNGHRKTVTGWCFRGLPWIGA
ncbi:rhodanese-like domain-containing protein [Trinickia diaoshuihuensis]|uniref:rhodanese-like domain-containing protein n=1 Tax=Trinickia diaoshuihuensis TaxID=2292265 RepID=UPI000E26C14C|nr:rhodanese-like domain-containing protein [Trinickia diaoshuihuensis]